MNLYDYDILAKYYRMKFYKFDKLFKNEKKFLEPDETKYSQKWRMEVVPMLAIKYNVQGEGTIEPADGNRQVHATNPLLVR